MEVIILNSWPYILEMMDLCKVFPSSLRPTTMKWFKILRKWSIHSFGELIQVFGAHFITCSWVPQPINSLIYENREWGDSPIVCSLVLGVV